MRVALLTLALATAGCATTHDDERRDASVLGDGETPLSELCEPQTPGTSSYDDDLDRSIDEGCEWHFGNASPLLDVQRSGNALRAPWLSGDKLRLYFVDVVAGQILVSSRASRDSRFELPRLAAAWMSAPVIGATFSADELEVIVALPAQSLARATRGSRDDGFGALTPLSLDQPPPLLDPALSYDGRELFFVTDDGTGIGRIHHAIRAGIGEPFAPSSTVLDGSQSERTPQPTEDDRSLFVSMSGVLVRVDRGGRGGPFGAPQVVTEIGAASFPFVSMGTRELFFVGDARPWSPIPAGALWRAEICRDGACAPRPIACPSMVWSDDQQHCYQPIATAISWDMARHECEMRDGHVATPTSVEERDRIAMLHAGVAQWIGGYDGRDGVPECNVVDSPMGCSFAWLDRNAWIYQAWSAGQPSGIDAMMARENCVAMAADATWDDRDCDLALPYVCETERYLTW